MQKTEPDESIYGYFDLFDKKLNINSVYTIQLITRVNKNH